jgi:A/G-specific adenine glycosylase
VRDYGGIFPRDQPGLLALPGIGSYTAGAIAAIAFDQPVAAVDGNVERVVARLYGIETPLVDARPRLRELAQGLVPALRPGDFAQAMMDLGATICIPARPKCLACPISLHCKAFASGAPEKLPVKPVKAIRPKRYGRVYWIVDGKGHVFIRRRPAKGLLGGMLEFPSSAWLASRPDHETKPPVTSEWARLPGIVRHIFTHFELELEIVWATLPNIELEGKWADVLELENIGLPSLMRKVAILACSHI